MSTILETHLVPDNIAKVRLSDYAAGIFTTIASRKGMKKAVVKGRVKVNNNIAATGTWINAGDIIQLLEDVQTPPKPYRMPLRFLFMDDHLAVVFKPAGLLVNGNQFKTLHNALAYNLPPSKHKHALPWPLTTHRLDKATSGLMIIARTTAARVALGQAFEQRKVSKTYHALCTGQAAAGGVINIPLNGKKAFTTFENVKTTASERYGNLSLIRLHPETGRKHQLRLHLSQIGHPILGDKLYAPPQAASIGKGLFLCATGLGFEHPIVPGKRCEFWCRLPNKFGYVQEREERRVDG